MKIITQREPEIIITHVAETQNKVKSINFTLF